MADVKHPILIILLAFLIVFVIFMTTQVEVTVKPKSQQTKTMGGGNEQLERAISRLCSRRMGAVDEILFQQMPDGAAAALRRGMAGSSERTL